MNDVRGTGHKSARTLFALELRPRLPEPLRRLDELACNLAYAWDRRIRAVFPALDAAAWRASAKNPRLFLRRLSQATLERAAGDAAFLAIYERAVTALDALLAAPRSPAIDGHLAPDDLVAYFCAEFGVHETLPIYSGGLGVLAGDHCKAASDLGLPLVAVGLLYRQGYFTQTVDAHGRQHAHAHASDFDELPATLCRDRAGHERRVHVEIGERQVQLRVWQARVGRVPLVLLDADVPENEAAERAITHQLYGGDADTRIRQEIVLGIGGLRALRALGHAPTVFHCNEGHAAFVILERLREQVAAGLDFAAALEAVAAANAFTTHTPVAAGHDVFSNSQVRWHLRALLPQLGASEDRLLALGAAEPQPDPHHGRFNMTTLALRGSRFHNGVSRIHGRVARRMERGLWPQVRTAEVPIRHITNGVHLPTFLAGGWARLFDEHLPGWDQHLLDPPFWAGIGRIPDAAFVTTRRTLKQELLEDVAARLQHQLHRNAVPESLASRVLHGLSAAADPLVMGFARRFATYKRATLILGDLPRLARLLGDPRRPALLIFAGKAHPRDQPAQALIQQLWQASLRPEFIGRLVLVEGYDLRLARHLVQGCDVWLNNPEYPLEACGTSGQKAALNGAINVSVLDGWWDEGYVAAGPEGPNGFAVRPADLHYWAELGSDDKARHERDAEECRQLLDLLEHEVLPRYFSGDGGGAPYGPEFVRVARNAMRTLIPRYNSARMVIDYVREVYGPAARHGRRRAADGAAEARALAAWKQHVQAAWPGVRLRLAETPAPALEHGQRLTLRALAHLNGLATAEVAVECELGRRDPGGSFARQQVVPLHPAAREGDDDVFTAELEPLAGLQHYRVRLRPDHPGLCHPFELGLVIWA